jgi:DNA repair exonuclease SbcCD ATPase subunit
MVATTQAREPEMGLTFEKVWTMFQESDRRMQELKEESDRRMQKSKEETDRQIQETAQQIRETAKQMRETDLKMQELIQSRKETDRQIGKLGNRFGELAEHLVSPNITQKFNALGFHFDEISELRQVIKDESGGRTIAEFDILLENSESIVGVEVKSKPSYDDVSDHVQRLKILRQSRDKKGDKRKIHGALAGAIMPDSVRTAAIKAGFYVIVQTGDTVKIDIPEGFTPKTW